MLFTGSAYNATFTNFNIVNARVNTALSTFTQYSNADNYQNIYYKLSDWSLEGIECTGPYTCFAVSFSHLPINATVVDSISYNNGTAGLLQFLVPTADTIEISNVNVENVGLPTNAVNLFAFTVYHTVSALSKVSLSNITVER